MTLILCCVIFLQGLTATSPVEESKPAPIVDYKINASLDPEKHLVTGDLTLVYTNQSPDVLDELQFHAYLNAALNSASTYNLEGGYSRGRGHLRMTSCSLNGQDAMNKLHFIIATEASPEDRTVFALPLTNPLFPGESVTVQFGFESLIPENWDRVGYVNSFYFIGQWFPKVGVWETTGARGATKPGWNCHANHNFTEYFADFGNYHVTLTVPEKYVVGATGEQLGSPTSANGKATYTFHQDNVHDFGWVAWPNFKREVRTYSPPDSEDFKLERARMAKLLNLPLEDLTPKPVEMILLLDPDHEGQEDRHFDTLSQALTWFGLYYKPYPYQTITVVDVPRMANFAGGMEYPTLVTVGSTFENPLGKMEETLVHEFAHQYFYGMVATNEVEESWMDEGFTDYVSLKLMQQLFGNKQEYAELQLPLQSKFKALELIDYHFPVANLFRPSSREMNIRMDVLKLATNDVLNRPAWQYQSYWNSSYGKPCLVLAQLEREIGSQAMSQVLNHYVRTWAFRHPTAQDFIEVTELVTGKDMDWFFKPLLEQSVNLDFYPVGPEIWELTLKEISEEAADSQPVSSEVALGPQPPPSQASAPTLRNKVKIYKRGSIDYPVDVRVTFSDGKVLNERWAGDAPNITYTYDGDAEVSKIEVDPQMKVLFDKNFLNNSFTSDRDTRAVDRFQARWLVYTQHLLQFLAGGL